MMKLLVLCHYHYDNTEHDGWFFFFAISETLPTVPYSYFFRDTGESKMEKKRERCMLTSNRQRWWELIRSPRNKGRSTDPVGEQEFSGDNIILCMSKYVIIYCNKHIPPSSCFQEIGTLHLFCQCDLESQQRACKQNCNASRYHHCTRLPLGHVPSSLFSFVAASVIIWCYVQSCPML